MTLKFWTWFRKSADKEKWSQIRNAVDRQLEIQKELMAALKREWEKEATK